MKKTYIFITLLFFITEVNGQNQVSIDFENDGKKDIAILKQTEDGYFIQYTLSSDGKKHSTKIITRGGQENTLTVSKNVLVINSQWMRSESYSKFRYDKKSRQVILIGYDTSNYGNLSNDGSGYSSYNLLTGYYEANWNSFDETKNELVPLPTVTKKLPIKIYTLENFSDQTIKELEAIEYK
jgi:hypothetical protein